MLFFFKDNQESTIIIHSELRHIYNGFPWSNRLCYLLFPRHYYELGKGCSLHKMRLLHISSGNGYLIYDPTCYTINFMGYR